MILPLLYHWAPADRHKQIVRYGLKPGCRTTIGTVKTVTDGRHMICLSPSPSAAWSLSGAMPWARDVPAWDLWQVRLDEHDEIHIQPCWGPIVQEIRVAKRIPKSRIWYVAQRDTDRY